MLVTLTGAYKNAGDYLIGHRARNLLRTHVDSEIVNIDRKSVNENHYEVFNSARAVLLTGGPAYQAKMFPQVYSLDLERINVPVIPFGLGWKGGVDQSPADFEFTAQSTDFIRAIHQQPGVVTSCRDFLTQQVLENVGVSNVLMTGCPAWYDETKIAQDFVWPTKIRRVVLSMPAHPHAQVWQIMDRLHTVFPRVQKYLSFQAGYESPHAKDKAKNTAWNKATIRRGLLRGFRPISFESNFEKFESFMSTVDFHLGYRVHSHIFSLSQRIPSILIAEDSRGVGQAEAMGTPVRRSHQSGAEIIASLAQIRDTEGHEIAQAIAAMRERFGVMQEFLQKIA